MKRIAARSERWIAQSCLIGVLAAAFLALGPATASAQSQFQLGLSERNYAALDAIHGSVVRIIATWSSVAPASTAGFQPSNPEDPQYHWTAVDAAVRSAAQHHVRVILCFDSAPTWAEGPGPVKQDVSQGAWDPNQRDFATFMRAAAERYSGSFPDPLIHGAALPRVKLWEVWNEPNIPGYFSAPQPVDAYRTLLNSAYGAIKSVRSDNVIAVGGLAPVSPVPGSIPALQFGAQLLCLHSAGGGLRANRSCPQRAEFDAFAIHPYSLAATPTKHAYKAGDVLMADIGKVSALVRAADRLHTAAPGISHQIWVTEFQWWTNPPNTQIGDSESVAARYVAYSMYEMWRSGVGLVIWTWAEDSPTHYLDGGGLYTDSGTPKLTLQAYAFPLIASVSHGGGYAWGRAPVSGRVRVAVDRAVGARWVTVARVRTGSDGVFQAQFRARGNGLYRARVIGGPTSLSYDSKSIPPRRTHAYKIY
jgi:hypothetical protein